MSTARGTPALEVDRLVVRMGAQQILNEVSVQVPERSVVTVLGRIVPAVSPLAVPLPAILSNAFCSVASTTSTPPSSARNSTYCRRSAP